MKALDGFNVELGGIESVAKKQSLRAAIRTVLEGATYREVEPPILGYYSDMTARWDLDETGVFRFMDADGRLLALAPDLTLAVGSIALNEYAKNGGKPLRIYYVGKAYTRIKEHMRERIYDQVGAELVGAAGETADVEIITLATRAVAACGCDMTKLFVELSNLKYMKSLLDACSLTSDERAVISSHIARKNTFSMRKDTKNSELCQKVGELLDAVPSLYGDAVSVVAAAKRLAKATSKGAALAVAEDMERLCALLEKGLGGATLCLDLTTISDESYSGVTFLGMSQELGMPLFSGGRYDGVLGREEGANVPATGFSISVDGLMKIAELAKQGE